MPRLVPTWDQCSDFYKSESGYTPHSVILATKTLPCLSHQKSPALQLFLFQLRDTLHGSVFQPALAFSPATLGKTGYLLCEILFQTINVAESAKTRTTQTAPSRPFLSNTTTRLSAPWHQSLFHCPAARPLANKPSTGWSLLDLYVDTTRS